MKEKREWMARFLLPCCLISAVLTGIALAANGSTPTAVQADADTLAKTLLSEGIAYEEAVVLNEGKGYQYATFTGLPDSYYGFGDGIILSSGNAVKAFTSRPSANVGTSHGQSDASNIAGAAYCRLYDEYADFCNVANVTPKGINDAAVFAIKVTPTTNALSFRYFFASNEYNQAPQFNDTFALWVVQDFKGPSEEWTNIAKLRADQKPSGALSDVVNIQNTCPGCSKGKKYQNNIEGIYKYNNNKTIGYLGRTEALDAEIDTLTPGEPVWVVMAVGDASDHNFDSAVFIKAKSIKFAKASQTTITYDANGGAFSGGAAKTGVDVGSGATYNVGENITPPTRSGYVFDGWYDAEIDGTKAGATATAGADVTWYAHWKPVTSAVTVDVKQDGAAMPGGTTVELRQNGATAHKLTQSGGTWTASGVPNGTYQVFVNGEDVERAVTVNATEPGKSFSATAVNYYTVTAHVTLDGKVWSGQTAALSDGTTLTGSGPYTAVLREKATGSSYDVLVNGENKGTVAATASGNKSVTAAYHTIQVTVKDTAAWTDAAVTLRSGGADAHKLTYDSAGKTYTTILPASDTNTYSVFVGGKDVGQTVSTTSKSATATFYTASVKITGGFANMPVTIYNGTDSYTLTGGNTSGTTAYTCKHVFSGSTPYSITVGGTIGTVTNTISNANAVALTYRTVTFQNAGGGTHATQYVLSGGNAQDPGVPLKTGYAFLGWADSSSATAANFNFSTAISANTTLYPVYEAAGIVLGAQIQTGSTSVYTYQMPNLTVKGYASVESVVLEVTNCGGVSVTGTSSKTTSLDTGGNGTIILKFNSGTTGAAAQTALRSMTVTVKDYKTAHTIQATVYGNQN